MNKLVLKFVGLVILSALAWTSAAAQSSQSPDQPVVTQNDASIESVSASSNNTNTSPVTNDNQQSLHANIPTTVLKLEETIRGNKEQPQVLTIVPWQLPIHQRISENRDWLQSKEKLPPIERSAFLRKLDLANSKQ